MARHSAQPQGAPRHRRRDLSSTSPVPCPVHRSPPSGIPGAQEPRRFIGATPRTRSVELPKNGLKRTVVLTTPAKEALAELPRAVNSEELIFRGARGKPITGRTQHYYWHPIRCRFGQPSILPV